MAYVEAGLKTIRDETVKRQPVSKWILIAGLVIIGCCGDALREASSGSVPGLAEQGVASAQQLILVVTADWNAVDGQLSRFEREEGDGGKWRRVGREVPVVVGKNGLAWAAEYKQAHGHQSDPIKREGDGRSPAGIFTLGPAFGYDPVADVGELAIDYLQVTKAIECVDDCQSSFYNQLIDGSRKPDRDWKSSEIMRRDDDYYRLGVVVNYNFPNPVACRGSCIFLHLWEGPGIGTVGCTAAASEPLQEIVRWLDKSMKPVLVQLTELNRHELKWLP